MRIAITVLILVALFFLAPLAHATDVYWYPTETALDLDQSPLQAGDTLYICGYHAHPVPYGNLTVTTSNITVTGECPGDPGTMYGAILKVEGADYVKIRDVTLVGDLAASNGKGVTLFDTVGTSIERAWITGHRYGIYTHRDRYADSVSIRDSVIINNAQGVLMAAFAGDLMSVKKGWIIEDNLIQDVYQGNAWFDSDNEGVGVQGAYNVTIRRNVFRNCEQGIIVWVPETGILDGVLIEGNVLIDMHGDPQPAFYSFGVAKVDGFNDSFRNVTIKDNVIVGAEGAGIRWGMGSINPAYITGNKMILTGQESGYQLRILGGNVIATDNICAGPNSTGC